MKNLRVNEVIFIIMLLVIIIINGIDFIKDMNQGDELLHISLEILIVALSIWGIVILVSMACKRTDEIDALNQKVEKAEINLELSRSKLKEIGHVYSRYIHKQFEVWKLTPSEKEVALILLKGLSLKKLQKLEVPKKRLSDNRPPLFIANQMLQAEMNFLLGFLKICLFH